ncbi:MAG: winged helix-turn-helix transcriptional regulator [Myxococcales bacterium]|nr:winged helix-turn-helix transcriptional regulator [Myxococcales bacterium]
MRNVAICKVFRELGLIENMGTGIEAVFSSYEQRGLKLPEINEDKNYVKCILPRTPMSKMNELFLHPGVSSEDNDILNLLNKKSHISISDVVNELGLARSTAGRRLAILVEKGFICKRGVGKATKYFGVQQKKLL